MPDSRPERDTPPAGSACPLQAPQAVIRQPKPGRQAKHASMFAPSVPGMIWALPCSLIGGLAGVGFMMLGGSARRVGHTFEIAIRR